MLRIDARFTSADKKRKAPASLAAAGAFKTARDGKRAERVLVNGAREKVDEMSALGEEMDEWSPFDEVDDMRGARRELERSGAARGFGNRGGDASR
jgi:hypothetical protein